MLHSAPDRRLSTITVSQRGSSGNASDDAQAFFVAGNITDFTQQTAINYLIDNLKNQGLWTKMKVIYPFVGGTATAHALNLKNTALYPLTFTSISHSSAGITGVTTTIASSAISSYTSIADIPTDTSFGYYGTSIYVAFNQWLIGDGASTAGGGRNGILGINNNSITPVIMGNAGSNMTGFLGSSGFKVMSSLGGVGKAATNQIESTSFTAGSTVSTSNWRMVCNTAGSGAINTYSFFFVGNGLTSAEMLTLHNIVGTYQGILSRSLYTFDITLHPWTNRFNFTISLTDATQIYAINQLINSLDNNGLLDTVIVYPFVGTTLTAYAYSLNSGVGIIGSNTYSTLGLDPNVATSAGISTVITSSNISGSSGFIGFYCNEDSNITAYDIATGTSGTGGGQWFIIRNASNQFQANIYGAGLTNVGSNTTAIGSYHIEIPAGTGSGVSSTIYKNGSVLGTAVHGTFITANANVRVPGSLTNTNGAGRRFAVSYVGTGSLTISQITTLNTIINTYVTALGRQ
jgi:hypothetical protein